ncbi:PDZ and LIM domain protein 2 [Dissostichus eleginoides]|uniref:PDZ and LIM domain protein 2 n=1 Tax=Dissostichus eleginoides TaxID=100907 RepID=A0AAD9BYQ4_DISEL|nr:PDZ and LIM domain protein 2 [Dissostichus eleginoides]
MVQLTKSSEINHGFLNSRLHTWFRLLQEVGLSCLLTLAHFIVPFLFLHRSSPLQTTGTTLCPAEPPPHQGATPPHSPIDRDVPMSPRRSSSSSDFAMQKFDRDSEVYKMIQENKESRTAPRQSNTFKMLQEVLEADEKEAALRFPGLSPNIPKSSSSVGGVKNTHTCEKCSTGILTLAVRISDDRFRHAECYTCTDCGLNLKMRGHFCVGDVMYCEKHAKERYQGPGTSPQATVSPRQ